MSVQRRRVLAAGGLLLCFILLFCVLLVPHGRKLVLYHQETGQIYRQWEIDESLKFSISYVHSVSKSPVRDLFRTVGDKILAAETRYYSFGAGTLDELGEGAVLSYGSDGSMIVSGLDLSYERLNLIVGTVYDHILSIGEEQISLTKLCGKNAPVSLEIR
ncbi:DUF1850 domain-containing protein [Anaerolentibacter hominis]|uniref:DUF1850 domain-containing protein n=1 Tax=Anaerolentibacter hominis TaxID=3079009 RepID=UPI0031B87C66